MICVDIFTLDTKFYRTLNCLRVSTKEISILISMI